MCGSTPAVVSHDITPWQPTITKPITRRVNDCAACYGEAKADAIFKALKHASTDSADEYRQVLSQAIAALQSVAADISA